jgi:putative sterol carrier protein
MSEIAAAVKAIFDQMADSFNPDAAQGVTAVIQFDLSGEGAAQYYADIKDGACTVAEGKHDSPSMTLTMTASDYVDMTQGKLDGMSAFMSGKLKVGGDMGLAMKMQNLFTRA